MSENKPSTETAVDGVVHTPGPWVAVSRPTYAGRLTGEECDVTEVSGTATRSKIATVYWSRDQKLIAAAPDLLAACEAFLEADNHDGIQLAYVMAREAVAKAV